MKSKRCDNGGVSPLMNHGILQCDSEVKANLLNEQFVSVFTTEDTNSLPDLGPAIHPEVPSFTIEGRWSQEAAVKHQALFSQWPRQLAGVSP